MHTWRRLNRSCGSIYIVAAAATVLCFPVLAGADADPWDELPPSPVRLSKRPVPGDLEQLRCQYTREQIALLEKLNRTDANHLIRLGEITVPDRWDFRELDYSPLPAKWSWARGKQKALLVHQPSQVFGAYENGRLVRWGPVSSGSSKRPTPPGIYHLNWKSRGRRSTVNPRWYLAWYFNFINEHGISFHQYALPGHPASHGCIRLLERDARWLYQWGEQWKLDESGMLVQRQGTPVWIMDSYPYRKSPAWHSKQYVASGGRIRLDRGRGEDTSVVLAAGKPPRREAATPVENGGGQRAGSI